MQTVNFYKIVSANTNKCYVGSTVKTLEQRLQNHEAHYNLFKESKYHFVSSFDILEFKDYSIELIETKECETKIIRRTNECFHIIYTPNTINKVMPGRARAQHYQDNKQQIIERHHPYYQDNKQHAQQKHNCNCGGKYTTQNKIQHENTKKHQTFIRNHQPLQRHAQVINNYFNNASQ